MAAAPPATRDALRADLVTAMQESSTAGNFRRAQSRNSLWGVWTVFCTAHNLPHLLDNIDDPVPILQAFMRRYRDGRLALRGLPVRARTVEDVARQVGRTFVELGSADPRLNAFGDLDVRLSALVRHWKQADPEPNRVKPIPIPVLHVAHRIASASSSPGPTVLPT